MRRGRQGHVALPRGRARVPAWHGCDIYLYLLVYSMVIVHISIQYFGFKLMAKISSPYIRAILYFFPCATMFLCFR